jgi:hypothetical protein
MLVGNEAYIPIGTGYELLETQVLGSTQTSITFSNLNATYSGTYQHLQLVATVRSNRNDTDDIAYITFNGDTAANYYAHRLRGNGSNVVSEYLSAGYPNGMLTYGSFAGATAGTGVYGVMILDLPDAFETTKKKTIKILEGQAGAYKLVELVSGAWNNTNAITSININPYFGDLVSGSRFSLYGLRSA